MKASLLGGDPQERRLIISRFLQRVGGESSYFVGILGYAAYDLHASAALIATIMFCLNGTQMIGSMVAGFFIDRFGPRKVLLVSQVGIFIVTMATQFVGKNVPAFIFLAGCIGFLFAHFNTGFASFAPYMVKGTDALKRVNSRVEVASYAATIIGPLIGAAIVTHAPTIRVFLFNAAMTVASAAFMWRFTERYQPDTREDSSHPLHEVKRGLQIVFSENSLKFFLVMNILIFFAFGAFDSLESLYYKDVVGVGVQWMGYVNAAIGAGLLVGAYVLGRFKAKQINTRMLAFMVLLEGIGTLIYVATHSIIFVMIGAVILGFAFGAAEPLMRTLIQAVTPMQYVGRVMGTMQLVRAGGTLIPLILAPALSDRFGVQGVLVGAAVLTILFALGFVPGAIKLDRENADKIVIDHIDPFADGEEAGSPLHEREVILSDEGLDLAASLAEGAKHNREEDVLFGRSDESPNT